MESSQNKNLNKKQKLSDHNNSSDSTSCKMKQVPQSASITGVRR